MSSLKRGLSKVNTAKKQTTRRRILQGAAASAAASAAAGLFPVGFTRALAKNDKPEKKPNILFIFVDQHRPELYGAAGAPVIHTPNIDRLAREGTRFSRMWCQGPICRPSRAALLTGLYPHQNGIANNLGSGPFKPEWPNYIRNLKEAGYTTAMFGKTHFSDEPPGKTPYDMRSKAPYLQSFGFEHVREEPEHTTVLNRTFTSGYTEFLRANGYLETFRKEMAPTLRAGPTPHATVVSSMPQEMDLTSYLAGETIDWLKKRDRNKPFFAIFGPAKPHPPFQADQKWASYYADKTLPPRIKSKLQIYDPAWGKWVNNLYHSSQIDILTEEQMTEIKRTYYAMVSLVDQKVGEIIAELEKQGELDNTWIIYSADHGEMLWDHGFAGKFIFHFHSVGVPGIIRAPTGKPAISLVDVPTESFGFNPTILEIAGLPPLPGTSAKSLLPLMANPASADSLAFAEVSGNKQNNPYFASVTNKTSRLTMDVRSGKPVEFYDLKDDPDESVNLVQDPARQQTIKSMNEDLLQPYLKLPPVLLP